MYSSQRKISRVDLLDVLAHFHRREISSSTFYRWLSVCKITPNDEEGYSNIEASTLIALVQHLGQNRKYQSFDPSAARILGADEILKVIDNSCNEANPEHLAAMQHSRQSIEALIEYASKHNMIVILPPSIIDHD